MLILKCFVPEVRGFQNSIEKSGKVLLLINNAPIPGAVHYRRRLLEQLLCSDNLAAKSTPDFYKMVDLRDCCYLVAESWEATKQSTLRNAWNKILAHSRTVESSADNDTVEDVGETARTLRHLPPYSECAEADVHRWLT
uniref:DDE-1 domain-containing protein n=1 Tax=Trichuris muris TaxID=70415 RepID=A0A5S6QFD8_TRIMR